jgi:uncharacterized membrane protein YhhN
MQARVLAVSILCSAVYTATIATGGFTGRAVVKALAIAALAFLARSRPILAAGLFLGSIGDALLESGGRYFVAGLAAFLCGHVAYTVHFLRAGRRRSPPAAALALAAYGVLILVWLWPGLGALRLPVMLYVATIIAMVAASLRAGGWAAFGASLFLLSDSLLAANRFREPIRYSGFLVWGTYYAAQLSIALGSPRRSRQ